MCSSDLFRARVTSGVCSVATSSVGKVTVSPATVVGTASGDTTVCASGNTVTMRLTGSVGSIQWQSSADGGTWTAINGATSSTYSTSNLTSSTYYRARVKSGVCDSLFSNVVTVTVSPAAVSGSINGAATVCYQNNGTVLTLNGYTGNIQWQSSATNNSIDFTDIADSIGANFTANNLTSNTYYRAVVTSGVCRVTSAAVMMTVNPATVAGTASGDTTVCASGNSVTVRLANSVGSIQWQSSTNNTDFSNISGATSATYTASNYTETTYLRARVKSGVCDSLFSNAEIGRAHV